MIATKAVEETVKRLMRYEFAKYSPVVQALQMILEEQSYIEEERETGHKEIINEIGEF